MPALSDILQAARGGVEQRPWPRGVVNEATWRLVTERLADGRATLLDLWSEPGVVHMAVRSDDKLVIGVVSLDCPDQRFPSVGRLHPPAIRLERTIRDMTGLVPDGAPDERPWLDHGTWRPAQAPPRPYDFLPVKGESVHQVPVGPVHAGIIEPGHFRFSVNGETVVRLEERFGYTHKGTERLFTGSDLPLAARIAGRVSGDSTVAYAWAFSSAVEHALGVEPPPRAAFIRAVMAELERVANHLGDIGAVCNDAAFALLHAHFGILRERVLRTSDAVFGHRLMMDRVVPGGVSVDLPNDGPGRILDTIREIRSRMPALVELYDNTASLQDRTVGTGIVRPALAATFGAGGFVGRASGRQSDARRAPGYGAYPDLSFEIPVRQDGDVNARVWIRIDEVQQSLAILEQALRKLQPGAIQTPVDATGSAGQEGLSLVEGFRGDILCWVRIGEDGKIARCRLRDPSWFQWPLLESAIEGNIMADFPLCNKSFNCSYSGHDL